jgi:uncharacterized protein
MPPVPGTRLDLNVQSGVAFMTNQTFHLLSKHQQLDAALRRELARRWPDSARIANLKKLKLAVKDRLHRASFGQSMASA